MTDALSMFEESDIPASTGRPTKFPNPFPPAVDKLIQLRDAGTPRALTYDLNNLTDPTDETETMEQVRRRARNYLTTAGKERGVDLQMTDVPGGKVTIHIVTRKPRKPREAKPTSAE